MGAIVSLPATAIPLREAGPFNPDPFFNQPRQMLRGEWLYREGDAAHHIYLLEAGEVKLLDETDAGRWNTRDMLLPGSLIGETALFGATRRTESARCRTAVRVRTLSVLQTQCLLVQHPAFSQWVLETVGRRRLVAERRRYDLLHHPAERRIIDGLIDLVRERGQCVGYEIVLRNNPTNDDWAGMTGTCRQTVNAVLNRLRRQGLIHFTRRYLIVRDPERLFALAEGR